MASGIYQRFYANLMNKVVDLEADTILLALLDGDHSFTATHNTWADVSSNDIGNKVVYTANGVALASKAVTQGNPTKFAAANLAIGPAETLTAYHAVIYDSTAADNLICSIDFGGAYTCTNGTLNINWAVGGILTLAPA